MTFLVRHSPTNASERSYIYRVILEEFLGLDWRSVIEERPDVCIELQGDHPNRRVVVLDHMLRLAPTDWLSTKTLPQQPLNWWDTRQLRPPLRGQELIPVLYGQPGCTIQPDTIHLDIDIFGSCFFLLSRYEEAVKQERDRHGRFPASASLALQEGFLSRPVVNEYVEMLWSSINFVWPQLRRKQRRFRTVVTCDVDRPLTCWARSTHATLRKLAGDCIAHRDLHRASRSLRLYFDHRATRYDRDPFFTFDWMLEQCERTGHQGTFNFICAHTHKEFDSCYRLDEPFIRNLLRTLHARGHQIGLHGSYNSYLDSDQLTHEVQILRATLDQESIQQEELGARQHYLRWRTPDTAQLLDEIAIDYDSTLGFADHAGFRCGTCYEYPLYNLKSRRPLRIRERPLVVMEQSVISAQYLAIAEKTAAFELMSNLKNQCRRFCGDFVLLWHNSSLTSDTDRELYQALLAA